MTECKPEKTGPRPLWLVLAPGIFLLFWSGGFTFAKMGLAHAEPITFLAIRYMIVLALLLPLALVLRPPLPKKRAEWLHLAVVGLLIQALYFGLSYWSLKLGISAGGMALILSLQPVLVAVLAPWLAAERIGVWRWVGFGFGFLGAALVIVARSEIAAASVLALVCAFVALAGITAGTLYEKKFGRPHHPVTSNLVQYAVGLAAILPLALLTESFGVNWTGELAISLAYLVIANSLISVTLLLLMVRRGEISRVSALFFMVPPTAALIAWLVLDEGMPPLALVGMACATVGVAIASRPTPRLR